MAMVLMYWSARVYASRKLRLIIRLPEASIGYPLCHRFPWYQAQQVNSNQPHQSRSIYQQFQVPCSTESGWRQREVRHWLELLHKMDHMLGIGKAAMPPSFCACATAGRATVVYRWFWAIISVRPRNHQQAISSQGTRLMTWTLLCTFA